jgi:hypothetical protein
MLEVVVDSHRDHGLTDGQFTHLLERLRHHDGPFVETVELPEDLGTVLCGLHGPVIGDPPVPESEVVYSPRGKRPYASRLVSRPGRRTRLVTVVGGPYEGKPCVLFTMYGGPPAAREPGDPNCPAALRPEAVAFWAVHALSTPDMLDVESNEVRSEH